MGVSIKPSDAVSYEKDNRLLIVEGEFSSTLKVLNREGNTLSPVVRNAWDSGDLNTLVKNNPAKATGAHISIIGHITKQELLKHLDETEAANGFGNRFLWVYVDRSKILPEGGRLQDENLAPIKKRLKEVVKFGREADRVNFDKEARALWHQVYGKLSEGKPGLLGAMIARAEAQVLRLAVVYALLDQSKAIRLPHLQGALAVWEYCDASCRYIFGDRLGEPVADRILTALRENNMGLTRTDISKLLGNHQKAQQIHRALGSLLENGLAKLTREPTKGKPVERWFAL